jgi:hypothetical protein
VRATSDPGDAGRRYARLAGFVERHALNPQLRLGLPLRLAPRAFALLETIGRRSGNPRGLIPGWLNRVLRRLDVAVSVMSMSERRAA